jgi:hypothetical protein
MADPTPAPTPAPTTWFSTLSPELQAHITTKGWDKDDIQTAATKAIHSHHAAERLIGAPADQLLRLPKDATDPAYKAAYDRIVGMALPKDASEYKFDDVKFKDGTMLDEEDAAFVRNLATELKLTPEAARGVAQALAKRAEDFEAQAAGTGNLTKEANAAALRATWGAEFDNRSFAAMRSLEAVGFTKGMLEYMATLPQAEYIANMNAAVGLGQKMGEAAMLRGAGGNINTDPTVGMTAPQAVERFEMLKADPAWSKKFMAGDAEAHSEWRKLTTIMASARVPR